MSWEIDPRSDDDTIIVKRVTAGGGGIMGLIILYLLGEVFKWISENLVFIVIILAIIIICAIICYILSEHSSIPELYILITIIVSLGLIFCVIYFGPMIKNGTLFVSDKFISIKATTINVYNYIGKELLIFITVFLISLVILIITLKLILSEKHVYDKEVPINRDREIPNSLDDYNKNTEKNKYPQSKNIKVKCSLDEDVIQYNVFYGKKT